MCSTTQAPVNFISLASLPTTLESRRRCDGAISCKFLRSPSHSRILSHKDEYFMVDKYVAKIYNNKIIIHCCSRLSSSPRSPKTGGIFSSRSFFAIFFPLTLYFLLSLRLDAMHSEKCNETVEMSRHSLG